MDRINNIIYYAIVVLFIGCAAYFFHSYVLAVMTLAMVLLPIVSFFLMRLSVRGLKISLADNKTVYRRSKDYRFKLKVSNHSLVPVLNYSFRLEMKNAFSDTSQVRYINLSVPMRGSRVINIDICPGLCGRIDITVGDITVRDLLSFFEVKLGEVGASETYISIKVMPVRSEIEGNITTSENVSDEAEEVSRSETGDETVDIREYMPGDSLKNIHWKLSAKKTGLYVREKGEAANDTAVLLFELKKGELNGILDEVYSVLLQYCTAKQPIRLYWSGTGREQLISYTINNEDDISDAFDKVYTCSLSIGEGHALGTAKRQLSGGSVLYVGSADKGVTIVDL